MARDARCTRRLGGIVDAAPSLARAQGAGFLPAQEPSAEAMKNAKRHLRKKPGFPGLFLHRTETDQTVIGFGLSTSSLYSLIARLTSFALTLPSFASAARAAWAIQ